MLFKKCYKRISADDVKRMMSESYDVLLIDVRDKDEYQEGHIGASRNIPVSSLAQMKHSLPKDNKTPVITYCLTGMRARRACKALHALGYNNIYCLGGISAWPDGLVRKT